MYSILLLGWVYIVIDRTWFHWHCTACQISTQSDCGNCFVNYNPNQYYICVFLSMGITHTVRFTLTGIRSHLWRVKASEPHVLLTDIKHVTTIVYTDNNESYFTAAKRSEIQSWMQCSNNIWLKYDSLMWANPQTHKPQQSMFNSWHRYNTKHCHK